MNSTRTFAPGLAAGLTVVALLAGCSDSSEFKRLSADVDALRVHVEALESAQADLGARLRQREARRASSPDREPPNAVALVRSDGSHDVAPTQGDATGEQPPRRDDPAAPAEELRRFTDQFSRALATEPGRKALAGAVLDFQAQQEVERRQRMAKAAIGVFAEEAGIGKEQSDELTSILLASASEIRTLWSSMTTGSGEGVADAGKRVQENMTRTLELRAAANEKVRMLLAADQFAKFEAKATELHNLISGPRTR